MAPTLDELCLNQDFQDAMATSDALRWILERDHPLVVKVLMSSAKSAEEKFQARLDWSAYPGKPPSLKFCHPGQDSLTDPTAWPICPGFRPASLDSCVHWTAEGQGLHPEWAGTHATRWDGTGNPLFRVLCCLQDTLDLSFTGRHHS